VKWRIIARRYGEQSEKKVIKTKILAKNRMLFCGFIANQTGIDLQAAFDKNGFKSVRDKIVTKQL
jgi:hypothetical protein